MSPPSLAVTEAINEGLSRLAEQGAAAFGDALSQRNRLKARLGELFGVASETLALVANTTTGVADIASCLSWRPGDRIVTFEGEFPANVTPWHTAVAHGARVDRVPLPAAPDGSTDLERLSRTLATPTRLVAVSAVQFQTGWRVDLAALVACAHAHGAAVFVDAIQAAGVVPLDLAAIGADYVSVGSHKWLMGTEGLAMLYIAPKALEALVPRRVGWLSHEGALDFLVRGPGHLRYDRPIRRKADAFELGAPNALGARALEASVGLIAALGVQAIFDHVQAIHDRLEPGLLALGFESARALSPSGRSGSLSVRPGRDLAALGVGVVDLQKALLQRGVASSTPDGWLRFSPHWPCGLDEAAVVLEAMAEVTRQG